MVFVNPDSLNVVDDALAAHNVAKHCVTAIEPRAGHSGDVELRAIGVGAAVGHAEHVGLVVFEVRLDLVCKLAAPD